MNLRQNIDDTEDAVANYAEFSDDGRYFIIAVQNGFKVFAASTSVLYLEQDLGWSSAIATMLGDTQITGLIQSEHKSSGANDKLVLWDSGNRKEAASIKTNSSIIRCRLSKTHIALVFQTNVKLYKHQPKIERIASYETSSNPRGLCCLGDNYLVLPGRTAGHLQVVTLKTLEVNITPAHTSALRAFALSPDEEVIATASETGTLIRLHSASACARMGELRRGVNPATIYSLAISPSGLHLAVTSDTNTLHIFNLPKKLKASGSSSRLEDNWQKIDPPSPPPPGNYMNFQKWGNLAKVPFAPRVFSDVYSFASAIFEPGSDSSGLARKEYSKGIVAWIEDQVLAVVSAGQDARYERFELVSDFTGKTTCVRVGWSRFLSPN